MVSKLNDIIKKHTKNLLWFFVAFFIFVLVVDLHYFRLSGKHLFENIYYVIGGDYYFQHQHFYTRFYQLLDEGVVGYSHDLFFGTNFYASKAYYLIGDVYAYIGYFFHRQGKTVLEIFSLLNVIRMLVSGTTMYIFISKHRYHHVIRIICSVCYILSGSMGVFIENPVFISFYSLLPLLFLGIENLICDGKYFLLSLSIALLACVNYILLFSALFFALFYFLCRFMMKERKTFLIFIQYSLKGLLALIIGLLLAGIVIYPSFVFMLNNPRISSNLYYSHFEWHIIGRILVNFITPLSKVETSLFADYWYYFLETGIYFGLLPFIGLFIGLFRNKKSIYNIALFGICCITLSHPFFGKFFNFTYSFRYTMMLVPIFLYLSGYGLQSILEHYNRKRDYIVILIACTAPILVLFISLNIIYPKVYHQAQAFPEQHNLKIGFILVMCYTVLLLVLRLLKKYHQMVLVVLCTMVIFESIELNQVVFSLQEQKLENQVIDKHFQTTMRRLELVDSGYYRISTTNDVINAHIPYNYNIPITYDSVYQYELNDFLTTARQYPDVNWRFGFTKLSYATGYPMLNIKYLITDQDENAEEHQWYGNYLFKQGPYTVYRFKRESGLLKSYHQFGVYEKEAEMLNKNSFEKPIHEVMAYLNSHLLFYRDDFNKLNLPTNQQEDAFYHPSTINNQEIIFHLNNQDETVYQLSLAFDKSWKAYVDDKEIPVYKTNGGFMGVLLPSNTQKLVFRFINDDLFHGKHLSIVGFMLLSGVYLIDFGWRKYGKYRNRSSQSS